MALSIVLAAIAAGLLVMVVLMQVRLKSKEERIDDIRAGYERQIDEIKSSYERQIEEIKNSYERHIESERASLGERFQAIAAQVMQLNGRQIDEQNRRSVETVLAPIKAQFEEFAASFRECYSVESRDRLTMCEEIKNLRELGRSVSAETARLTSALKGNNAIQGRWGEMVLQNILEHSGLERGLWFVIQETSATDDGNRIRPDALIHCPGNRDIIIDSKASLTAYFASLEATEETERDSLMKAHVRSIESHINELRQKDYQGKIRGNQADFVFMFMPHEGAFLAALRAKPELWQKAYESHVVLASPTHLITTIQLVEQMWRVEKQNVNTERIAEQGSRLLESLASILKDISSIGDHLNKSQAAYDSVMKRVTYGRNNLVKLATDLRDLGVKSKKDIPKQFDNEED